MRILGVGTGFSGSRLGKQGLVGVLSLTLLLGTWPRNVAAQDPAPDSQSSQQQDQDQGQTADAGQGQDGSAAQAPQHSTQTPDQLDQLVAPIALYPDSLVAQILAASTFPEQVVEADRFLQAHPDLKGDALAQQVDQQPWDPSVKALTAFPSVLGNMDKNLSWTSSLGDAYYNQEQDVMDAVQRMRQKAQRAGNLKTTEQQTVTTQGSTVTIQPASPDVVYVPAYDPWLVYGYPIGPWPGWYAYPGIWYGGPYLSFGVGFGIGFFGGYGWGWHHWGGFDWHNHYAVYNHGRYYSHSPTFYNRSSFYRGTAPRGAYGARTGFEGRPGEARPGGVYNRPGATTHPFGGDNQAARGYAPPKGQSGTHSSAIGGYNHGGEARSYSSRGSASFGGGHSGGGGGGHGGGGHR
jgi:uncharacterized membrane protein YgcG